MQIEEAGGRPQKPEAGGVLTGYKKVKTQISIFAQICCMYDIYLYYLIFDIFDIFVTK